MRVKKSNGADPIQAATNRKEEHSVFIQNSRKLM
jgi:hypothetical protein